MKFKKEQRSKSSMDKHGGGPKSEGSFSGSDTENSSCHGISSLGGDRSPGLMDCPVVKPSQGGGGSAGGGDGGPTSGDMNQLHLSPGSAHGEAPPPHFLQARLPSRHSPGLGDMGDLAPPPVSASSCSMQGQGHGLQQHSQGHHQGMRLPHVDPSGGLPPHPAHPSLGQHQGQQQQLGGGKHIIKCESPNSASSGMLSPTHMGQKPLPPPSSAHLSVDNTSPLPATHSPYPHHLPPHSVSGNSNNNSNNNNNSTAGGNPAHGHPGNHGNAYAHHGGAPPPSRHFPGAGMLVAGSMYSDINPLDNHTHAHNPMTSHGGMTSHSPMNCSISSMGYGHGSYDYIPKLTHL